MMRSIYLIICDDTEIFVSLRRSEFEIESGDEDNNRKGSKGESFNETFKCENNNKSRAKYEMCGTSE